MGSGWAPARRGVAITVDGAGDDLEGDCPSHPGRALAPSAAWRIRGGQTGSRRARAVAGRSVELWVRRAAEPPLRGRAMGHRPGLNRYRDRCRRPQGDGPPPPRDPSASTHRFEPGAPPVDRRDTGDGSDLDARRPCVGPPRVAGRTRGQRGGSARPGRPRDAAFGHRLATASPRFGPLASPAWRRGSHRFGPGAQVSGARARRRPAPTRDASVGERLSGRLLLASPRADR